MTDALQYTVRCANCNIKTRIDEPMLGERLTCPACDETFLVPAFPDPEAGVELILPATSASDSEIADDADTQEAPDKEETEVAGAGTWTPIVIGAIALVVIGGLLLFFNSGGESSEVDPKDIVILDRDVERTSDSEIKWHATVINSAKVKAEVSLELEMYNARGDVIHRDQTPYASIEPGHRRKLQRTSDYYSGDSGRAILRYEVVPNLR